MFTSLGKADCKKCQNHSQMYDFISIRYEITSDLVVLCRRTVVQFHSKCDSRGRLLLERFPHQPRDALPPCPFVLGRAGVVLSVTCLPLCYLIVYQKCDTICFSSYLCACFSSPAQIWVSADWLLWSLLCLPAACAWCSATGARVWVTAPSCCRSGWMETRALKNTMNYLNQDCMYSSPTHGVRPLLCPLAFRLTSSTCCTP